MKPRSVRGFDWIEEPTESSEEMPLMRRRPLARAATVGGTAYVAGKHHAQSHAREADQEAQIQELQAQQQYAAAAPPPAPAGGGGMSQAWMDQLKQLADLHTQGCCPTPSSRSRSRRSCRGCDDETE